MVSEMGEIIHKTEEKFYSDAVNYWSEIPATIDGMLGGFGHISATDIKGSKMLLKQLFHSKCPPGREYALDCGAGIGRVTKFLLTDLFNKVDMVEQSSVFLDKAKQYLGAKQSKVGDCYTVGLQDFQPQAKKYDVIWIQWVLGHLTNKDLLKFLENCKNGLKENGVIIIKENVTSSDDLTLDRQDSSVTRSVKLFQDIFHKGNLNCYRLVKQHNFPKGLYSVYMFILKPISNSQGGTCHTIEHVNTLGTTSESSENEVVSQLHKEYGGHIDHTDVQTSEKEGDKTREEMEATDCDFNEIEHVKKHDMYEESQFHSDTNTKVINRCSNEIGDAMEVTDLPCKENTGDKTALNQL